MKITYVPNSTSADGEPGTGSNAVAVPGATAYVPGSENSGQADGAPVEDPNAPMTGTWSIPDATQNDTVTGLALGFTPTAVVLTVQAPSGDDLSLSAELTSTPTSDGFSYALSGITDSANYKLHYFISA